jgi:hypothetical protein
VIWRLEDERLSSLPYDLGCRDIHIYSHRITKETCLHFLLALSEEPTAPRGRIFIHSVIYSFCNVLRQAHSLVQSESSTEYDPVLPLSVSSILVSLRPPSSCLRLFSRLSVTILFFSIPFHSFSFRLIIFLIFFTTLIFFYQQMHLLFNVWNIEY